MTIFNSKSNRQLEKGLEERALAGSMVLHQYESRNTNELIMYTLQTLEFLKRAYNEGNKEVYEEFITDGKFNDKVQHLINNSPAAINPNFVDVPIEELPSAIIKQYGSLMGAEYSDGYITIDPREVAKEHLDNIDKFRFYDTENNFKYSVGDSYYIGRGNLPTQPVYSLLGNINELYDLRERISNDFVAQNIIKVKEDELNYNAFMHLYGLYYFDLYMKTFYSKEMEIYKMFRTVNFVAADTEGALTFDELGQYKTDIGSLKEYVGLTYYRYRLDRETAPARHSINCRLNNRKLNEIGFVFGETDNKLIDLEEMRGRVIDTMHTRNLQGYAIEYSTSTLEMLNELPDESFDLISSNAEKVLGITDIRDFTYFTDSVMSSLNQMIHDFKDSLEPGIREEEDYQERFGYLAYANEIEDSIEGTIKTLQEEIESITLESE